MPDLVIKPTAGAGNKLILQDQGGGTGAIIENATITVPTIKLTPGSAPSSPVEGQIYYDSTSDSVKIRDGSQWQELSSKESATAVTTHATGGDFVETYTAGGNDYKVHIFYTSGIFQTLGARTVDVLIVAGGGGAHSQIYNGGGGAGGLIYKTSELISTQSNAVVVGAGGAIEKRGGDSEFNSWVALGGGRCSGGAAGSNADSDGGSGGGSSHSSSGQGAGLQPTSIDGGFGNGGGDQIYGSPHYGTGGGGGAGGAGADGTTGNGGAGGIGKAYTIRDGSTSVYYAGGGGGGRYNDTGTAAGGAGGGGNAGVAAAPHLGGGGGASKAGGSGIVIIRYAI